MLGKLLTSDSLIEIENLPAYFFAMELSGSNLLSVIRPLPS